MVLACKDVFPIAVLYVPVVLNNKVLNHFLFKQKLILIINCIKSFKYNNYEIFRISGGMADVETAN